MSFIPYVIVTIMMLKSIFIRNSVSVVKGINNTSMVILPINDPSVILFKFAPLFKTIDTVNNSIKSKAKLRNNTRSK